ncbi:PID-CTERM protein-sorting domain-containing protein [Marinoscillum sp.]|uniref:PID-CTERM protein-sorting domain-containing protein n=1 Tax=Marinoscillum sp. TaxID=2024838 RepID=UPI003BA89931
MNKRIIYSILSFAFMLPLMAQSAPPATPIDGGLSLLLAAGGAYGVKKLYDKRKPN